MVRNASRSLKFGVHLPFDPNFDMGGGTFYPEKFRQAYCTGLPKYFLLVQFFTQTPQGTCGQKVTALQFWALSGHVLPHYKSSKVGHFKATQANIGQLRSFCNVARYAPMIVKIRVFSPFDPKTCEEFEAFGQIIFEQAYCTVKCQYFLKCPVF